jgi:hypothetical protein
MAPEQSEVAPDHASEPRTTAARVATHQVDGRGKDAVSFDRAGFILGSHISPGKALDRPILDENHSYLQLILKSNMGSSPEAP